MLLLAGKAKAGISQQNLAKALISLFKHNRILSSTQQLHAQIILHGFYRSVLVGSRLANAYIGLGALEFAFESFSQIPAGNRNLHSWNTILCGYSKSKRFDDVLLLYNRMRREINGVDSFNLVFAIKACTGLFNLRCGKLVHCLGIKSGLERDPYVAPSLVEMYGELDILEDAQKMFDENPGRNTVLWHAMMKGYLKFSKASDVFYLFYGKRDLGLRLDAFTVHCLVRACGNVLAVKEGKSAHGLSIRKNFENCSAYLQTSLVDMYLKFGLVDCALKLFEKVGNKDLVLWTALISGLAKNGRPLESLSLFRQMLRESISPNELTLASILISCSSLGSLRHGKSVHGYMTRKGIEMDPVNYTSFIDMYSRCGCIEMARKTFDKMPAKNVVSWSAMINAFGINGMFSEALTCFHQMKAENQIPNSVTFVSILSACSHSGKVEEGLRYFGSMNRDYRITPTEEHHACMVDLLGRSGKIREAMSFMDNIPVKPRASSWGALLSACRIHKNVEFAEEIAEKLLPLESDKASVYHLLANTYADAGMWDLARKVRKKLGVKGLKKTKGFTAIEIGG